MLIVFGLGVLAIVLAMITPLLLWRSLKRAEKERRTRKPPATFSAGQGVAKM
jgi:hypothetical protein